MDRNADFLFERGDKFFRGHRFAKAGHVLDREDVRAHALNLLGLGDVILERILVALLIVDVARVANCSLAKDLAMFARGLHRDLHVGQVIERVEDAEDVHARIRRMLDEAGDDIVRVI